MAEFKDLVKNGTFTDVVKGTSARDKDPGNPADWEVTERMRAQVTTGAPNAQGYSPLIFNILNSPSGASIKQTVTGVEANGENITFSFKYNESGSEGRSNPPNVQVQAIISELGEDGQSKIILNEIATHDPRGGSGFYQFTFPAQSESYLIEFHDVSKATKSGGSATKGRDVYITDVKFVAPVADTARNVPCFTIGTLIDTPDGSRKIETLIPGDLVITRNHAVQAIRWIGCRTITFGENGTLNDKLRPVRIKASALGANIPNKDLIVSPQHRMLVSSRIARRMFQTEEVLAPAKHLTGIAGIEIDETINEVTYIHILLDNHDVVLANQAWSETLYLGKQALKALTNEQREEIISIFPELIAEDFTPPAVHTLLKGYEARNLVARSRKNSRELVEA